MFIDSEGNIFSEFAEGLTEIQLDMPEEPLEGFTGDIWFDERTRCMIDDREKAYWYKVEDGQLVKYDWLKRYDSGEFTVNDFKNKILKLIRSNYIRDIQSTDSVFLAYQKRKELGILDDGDELSYLEELNYYKSKTLEYRQLKNLIINAETIEDIINFYN